MSISRSYLKESYYMEEMIKNSLASVGNEFRLNELAYLALTTKIEHPLRDRWAFCLYNLLPSTYIVARDWRRTDLAILKEEIPQVLIELKAMYAFDAALDQENISNFCDALDADEAKAKMLADKSTEIYTVLLATHPLTEVPKTYDRIVKYRNYINKTYRLFAKHDEIASLAIDAVDRKLSGKNIVAKGSIKGGSAFGIGTDVLYWLVKAS